MSRINTNVTSLISQRVLGRNTLDLAGSLERLSTGLRINRGKDDPAGLIASEALRAEARGLNQAISNAERADQVANIAEGGLQEVSTLLTELQGLITQNANTAGLSRSEKEANQLQIDSILQTIDRVAAATSFQGLKLLNGNFDYTVDAVASEVASFRVNGAKLTFQGTRDVDLQVTQSAQTAAIRLSFGDTQLDLSGVTDNALNRFVIEIGGAEGSRELSFASGTALSDVVATINTFTDVTGVSATVSGTTGIRLASTIFGQEGFVSVKVVDHADSVGDGIVTYDDDGNYDTGGTGSTTTAWSAITNRITDRGQDLGATINGINATTNGKRARINTDFLDVEVELSTAASQALNVVDAFTITGGGADFQLAGEVNIAGKVSIGVSNVAVRELGRHEDATGTYYLSNLGAGRELNAVDGDTTNAQRVIDRAISDVSALRGRLGAFQKNTVGATIRSLGISVENTIAAESIIRDSDFASETSGLTRSQILVQSATQILGIANSQPQNVLTLLG